MKRMNSVVLLVLLAATAVGCSRKSTPTSPPPPVNPPVAPEVPPPPTEPPVEPAPTYMTIGQFLEARENGTGGFSNVILAGNVVAQATDDEENYLLRDATGQVRLERDEEDLPVGDNIRILGDPESGGCNDFPGVGEVCSVEVNVLQWERIQ